MELAGLPKEMRDELGIIYDGQEFADEFKPLMRKWEFGFPANVLNPRINAKHAIKTFADFLTERKNDKLEVVDSVILRGDVYGRKGFDDGENIHTSNIVSFERINRGTLNGIPRDVICATTESGSKYFFYSDDHSASMFLLLGAAIHMN